MSSALGGCMESFRRNVCYQADELCTLARDAIRDSVAITYNARGALITYQAFFVGLDKNESDLERSLSFLQAVCPQPVRAVWNQHEVLYVIRRRRYVIATKSRM